MIRRPRVNFLYIIVAVVALNYIGHYAYAVYARHTFLRPFYAHVAEAQIASQQIHLPHFVKQDTISESHTGRRANHVGDCIGVSYFTPHKSGDGLVCMKGFATYYGLPSYTSKDFSAVDAYMTTHGWILQDAEDRDLGLREIAAKNDLRGFGYRNDQDITASATFAPRSASWPCNGNAFCTFAQRSKDTRYAGYVDITVSYEQDPY